MIPQQQATLDRFLQLLRERNCSQATIKNNRRCLTTLAEYLPQPFEAMTADDLAGFLHSLTGLQSVNSRNSVRQVLRHFFGKVLNQPEKTHHPALQRERPITTTPRFPTDEEVDRLLNGTRNVRDRALLAVLVEGGMRIGALASFPAGSYDSNAGPAYMCYGDIERDPKYPSGLLLRIRKSKTRTERQVPIYQFAAYLAHWQGLHPTRKANDPLWCYQRAGRLYPLGCHQIWRLLKTTARRVGIEVSVYPHLFRKRCATQDAERGMKDRDIAQLRGWVPGSPILNRYIFQSDGKPRDRYAASIGMPPASTSQPTKTQVVQACANCGNELPRQANVCPKCGLPADAMIAEQLKEAWMKNREVAAQFQDTLESLKKQLAEQRIELEKSKVPSEDSESVRENVSFNIFLKHVVQILESRKVPEFKKELRIRAEKTTLKEVVDTMQSLYPKLGKGIKKDLREDHLSLELTTREYLKLAKARDAKRKNTKV
jgi:site-specific recombinase XerD